MSHHNKLLQFFNCRILRNSAIIKEDLWVRNGKIINPEKVFFDEKVQAHERYDCKNAIISPGFIELQINGGYGVDFSYDVDTVEQGVSKVAKELLKHGVTSFCPTVVTNSKDVYAKVLPKIKKAPGGKHGATVLGVHLEGPFINVEKKGAHPPECILELTEGFKTLQDTYGCLDNVSIVTLAPEKQNANEVIRELNKRKIIISLGHSMGALSHGEEAVRNGATFITHLFNAMLPFHHRDPGLVGLLASSEIPKGVTVYYGIISDGVHTHPAALRIAYRTHPDGVVLVTDAISPMGLEEGVHRIGKMTVEIRNHQAYVLGTNTLCGSITPMDECIKFFKKATNCGNVFALEAASLHPARCMGIDQTKGKLDFGCDADLVFLDDDLNVLATYIAGECVYRAN
uniref:N-acetylglucosamine-6-phosphate deacetylase n=1 Tax=Culicoides sonorensis TaxID=179676 RepID=A0A336LUT2_CULSO